VYRSLGTTGFIVLAKTVLPTERQAALAVPHLGKRSTHFFTKTAAPTERQAVQAY